MFDQEAVICSSYLHYVINLTFLHLDFFCSRMVEDNRTKLLLEKNLKNNNSI